MMSDDLQSMEYLTPRNVDSDWGYKILQVNVAQPGIDIFLNGPNPAGNYMLVFSSRDHKEELEVVLRIDQLVAVSAIIWRRFEEEVDEA